MRTTLVLFSAAMLIAFSSAFCKADDSSTTPSADKPAQTAVENHGPHHHPGFSAERGRPGIEGERPDVKRQAKTDAKDDSENVKKEQAAPHRHRQESETQRGFDGKRFNAGKTVNHGGQFFDRPRPQEGQFSERRGPQAQQSPNARGMRGEHGYVWGQQGQARRGEFAPGRGREEMRGLGWGKPTFNSPGGNRREFAERQRGPATFVENRPKSFEKPSLLKFIFTRIDRNGDGAINFKEFKAAVEKLPQFLLGSTVNQEKRHEVAAAGAKTGLRERNAFGFAREDRGMGERGRHEQGLSGRERPEHFAYADRDQQDRSVVRGGYRDGDRDGYRGGPSMHAARFSPPQRERDEKPSFKHDKELKKPHERPESDEGMYEGRAEHSHEGK